MAKRGLTIQQEKFCLKYHECGNASEAYRYAYPKSLKWKKESVWEKASTLLNNINVKSRVKELQGEVQQVSLITKESNLKLLYDIMNNPLTNDSNKIKAIEVSNKMLGFDEPTKIEADVTTNKYKVVTTDGRIIDFNEINKKNG